MRLIILISLMNLPLSKSNGYGGGNNGPPSAQYNPYNPYPYPCQCPPYPPTPRPNPNPLPPSQSSISAFAFTRARKNNQCLNLHMCFIQFDNEVTKINAVTYPRYGAFQATIPGLYFFTFTLALGGATTPRVSLRRNNDVISSVNGTAHPTATTDHMPVTSSILLQLQPQDAVYIVVEAGDVVEAANPLQGSLNSFSGYLVAPIFPSNATSNQPQGGGSPGFPGFPGSNNRFNGAPNAFNLLNPGANSFPSNINGMPPFSIGRIDEDNEEDNVSEKK